MFGTFIRTLAFALALFPALAFAQSSPLPGFPPGVFQNRAAIAAASSGYQGPGDIVSGATAWGSCARAYNAAYANGTNSLCDLVDSAAPTTVICTLRVKTNGFVDLTGTYCTGSVTPATKCAAATGAVCNVSKVYDQAGTTGGFLQATAADQPVLTFSALGGLPGMTFSAAAPTSLVTAGSVTISQTFSLSAVAERTGGTATASTILGATGSPLSLGWGTSPNQGQIIDPSGSAHTYGSAINDNNFYAFQGVYGSAASGLVMTVNGTDSTFTGGSGGISTALRIGRGSSCCTPTGVIMEGGFWPSGFSSGQRTSMNANQHSAANGYNF